MQFLKPLTLAPNCIGSGSESYDLPRRNTSTTLSTLARPRVRVTVPEDWDWLTTLPAVIKLDPAGGCPVLAPAGRRKRHLAGRPLAGARR